MTSYLGYNATLGIRNNNPFNIIYSTSNDWQGQIGENSGFCQFETIEYGIRAGFYNLINGYFNQGYVTIEGIINKYAPTSENDTQAYINFVSSEMDAPINAPMVPTYLTLMSLGRAIMKMEVGTTEYNLYISEKMINEGYNMLPSNIGDWMKPQGGSILYTTGGILLFLILAGALLINKT